MLCQVLLPLAVSGSYYYRVPKEWRTTIAVGHRVVVQFGQKRIYVGIVSALLPDESLDLDCKEVLALPDTEPLVSAHELSLWNWMASYYLTPVGMVALAALGEFLLPSSRTQLLLNRRALESVEELNPRESALIAKIPADARYITFEQLQQWTPRGATTLLESFIDKGIFALKEQLPRHAVRGELSQISFAPCYRSEAAATELYRHLQRRPAKQRLVGRLIALIDLEEGSWSQAVDEARLIEQPAQKAHLRDLITEGVLQRSFSLLPPLSPTLSVAAGVKPILLSERQPTLFHAPDYVSMYRSVGALVQQEIGKGGRVLLLFPFLGGLEMSEASIRRLLRLSSIPLYILTSLSTARERALLRLKMRQLEHSALVVGSRLAALMPLDGFTLVVICEEQDFSYKQPEPAPRYHARDVLVWRTRQLQIPLLLASVTPSVESLANAWQGKYHLLESTLEESTPKQQPPQIVDLKREREIHRLKWGRLLSEQLSSQMAKVLQRGGRILLLAARRGFAPYLLCGDCQYTFMCPRCEVALTYHREGERLLCHYCGFTQPKPANCPRCAHLHVARPRGLVAVGFGAQRVEEEVVAAFPTAKVLRIDIDAQRRKADREALARALSQAEADIYIGTRLVAQLATLPEMDLVAVLQLDAMTSFPDFRVDEEVGALLYGLRARYASAGMVVQTARPHYPLLQHFLAGGSYADWGHTLLMGRKELAFPPYARLIKVTLSHNKESEVHALAGALADLLRATPYFVAVQGPLVPFVAKVNNRYVRVLTLRLADYPNDRIKHAIMEAQQRLQQTSGVARSARFVYDVDPL